MSSRTDKKFCRSKFFNKMFPSDDAFLLFFLPILDDEEHIYMEEQEDELEEDWWLEMDKDK